jgi:hypothetical protein
MSEISDIKSSKVKRYVSKMSMRASMAADTWVLFSTLGLDAAPKLLEKFLRRYEKHCTEACCLGRGSTTGRLYSIRLVD